MAEQIEKYRDVAKKIRFGIELGDWNNPKVRNEYYDGKPFGEDSLTWMELHEFLGHFQSKYLKLYEKALQTTEGQALIKLGEYALPKAILGIMGTDFAPGNMGEFSKGKTALRNRLKKDGDI
jgi:hypothetical protein